MTGETVDAKSLGEVQRESITKNSNLLIFNMPRDDADQTLIYDFLGVTCKIHLEGTIAGSTAITTFIDDFLGGADLVGGKVTGVQDSAVLYKRPADGSDITISVYVNSVSTNFEAGLPDKLSYSMELIMGA